MNPPLQHITLRNFKTGSGDTADIHLSYEVFGRELHSAPIVLVNHALTGNSAVSGEKGWWKTLVGEDKIIDTGRFTVVCFNIPGNGYDGVFIENYKDFKTKDIARIFLLGLKELKITKLHSLIGGSVGGAIGWEMLALENGLAENFIPVASDYRTTDWLHSQCLVQEFLLRHSEEPLQKARVHAMLCYRTPVSINQRFNKDFDVEKGLLKSHDWLNYHGKTLNERFSLKAYKLMNQLLMTIDAKFNDIRKIKAKIHLIAVNSDLFFPAFEVINCYESLKKSNVDVSYHEINSIHGHDAFLMEYEQLNEILMKIVN
ncbi:alpha/beta fold hydrolase [Chryseobacterium taklimakanense]|uniref:alpha/beta fold hydrolase n=1 Tax=Chryseobacterium taklimakanense TaxID=536441 RepID=UPI001EF5EE40|nr:alpha/beta fold hydrolase [Chryseobacterium taklimakanense]MCG7281060.1 alpha/beta fold hydrolase [Chryseobacterium taklimakanense]